MKPTILLLGTAHLDNPDNGDAFKSNIEGLNSENRQKEMTEVINCLAEFKPTKITVEAVKERESQLNSQYEQYVNGVFELTNNEIHQIGFRLAERMNLTKLHAVDWNEVKGDVKNPWEWAKEQQPDLSEEIQAAGRRLISKFAEKYRSSSLRELLLWLNSPAYMKMDQEMYMKMALIGNDQNPVGIQWLSDYWVYRNLLIFKNVVEIVNSPEERILLMYGAGHLTLLSQYLQDSGLFQIEHIEQYF